MVKKALLVVDMQNDFLPPNGSLAVTGGDIVLANIRSLLTAHVDEYCMVVATQDWHPAGHVSFASTHKGEPFTTIPVPHPDYKDEKLLQILWPDHCVQETHGSELEAGLKATLDALNQEKVFYIKKGGQQDIDSYSAFADVAYTRFTALSRLLHQHCVTDIDIVGLALDQCVRSTIIDARKFGFDVRLLKAGTRAIDQVRGQQVLDELHHIWGVQIVEEEAA